MAGVVQISVTKVQLFPAAVHVQHPDRTSIDIMLPQVIVDFHLLDTADSHLGLKGDTDKQQLHLFLFQQRQQLFQTFLFRWCDFPRLFRRRDLLCEPLVSRVLHDRFIMYAVSAIE